MNRDLLLSDFESKYFLHKWHNFYKPKHREFLYESITQNIYNSELILTINWEKPVSRFIAEKSEHIIFINNWISDKWLYMEYRKLKRLENEENINNKINYIIYLWKNKENLRKIIDYDLSNYGNIWDLLWYPSCCSYKWENKNINKEKKIYDWNTTNLFLDYINSNSYPLLNNPFFNFTSNSLSFFYPCSLDCKVSLEKHLKYSQIIKSDNIDFYNKLLTYYKLPIMFLIPESKNILTTSLHFDEVFRIYFIWIRKGDTIFYKDFFILSFSFLDQTIDDDYKIESFNLLEKLIYWNKVYLNWDQVCIEWDNYKENFESRNTVKIINFS